jgi:hypothetical protein
MHMIYRNTEVVATRVSKYVRSPTIIKVITTLIICAMLANVAILDFCILDELLTFASCCLHCYRRKSGQLIILCLRWK